MIYIIELNKLQIYIVCTRALRHYPPTLSLYLYLIIKYRYLINCAGQIFDIFFNTLQLESGLADFSIFSLKPLNPVLWVFSKI